MKQKLKILWRIFFCSYVTTIKTSFDLKKKSVFFKKINFPRPSVCAVVVTSLHFMQLDLSGNCPALQSPTLTPSIRRTQIITVSQNKSQHQPERKYNEKNYVKFVCWEKK